MSQSDFTQFGPENVYAYYLKPWYIRQQELRKLLSFSKNYNRPIKFKVSMYDIDWTPIAKFDLWDAKFRDQEINLFRLGVNEAQDQTGDFFLSFFDHENNVDQSKLVEGSKIIIEMGRDVSKRQNLMFGILKNKVITRGKMDQTYIDLGGFGSEIILSDAQVNLVKSSELRDINGVRLNEKDQNMYAKNILLDFFENEVYMKDVDISLRDRGGFDLSKLKESTVNDFIGSLKFDGQVDGLSVCRKVADLTLSYFKVNSYNQPLLEYGNNKHSGVTLKHFDPNDRQFDYSEKTSYFKGDWSVRTSTEKTLGFANVLISETGRLREVSQASIGTTSFVSLFNKDLAQAIDITSPFQDLTLLLSKQNGGSDELSELHGHLIAVSPSDGLPTGSKITSFNIPLNQIPDGTTPAPITLPVSGNEAMLAVGSRIAIQLFTIGSAEDKTVYWFHDNDLQHLPTDPPSFIRPLPQGRTSDHNLDDGWLKLNNGLGPSFAFSLFNSRRFKCVVSDPYSIRKHGIISAPFDINFTDDLITTSKAMNATIFYTAKRRMDYTTSEVFIPEEYYFPVGDIFRIVDPKSGHSKRKSIYVTAYQRRIAWDASVNPHGIHTMQILPYSFYNPTYDMLDRLERDSCEC